jgi:hypothetical protein
LKDLPGRLTFLGSSLFCFSFFFPAKSIFGSLKTTQFEVTIKNYYCDENPGKLESLGEQAKSFYFTKTH